VVLVSHDRRFLENVTTRIVSLRGGVADVYPGGFRDFERFGAKPGAPPERKEKNEKNAKNEKHERAETGPGSNAGKKEKDKAVEKFEEQKQAARLLEKKKRRVKELEASIAVGEKELDALRGRLKEAPGDDWEKLANMAQEEQTLARKVDAMLVEWARLSEELQ
jgi:ATP-binding cassette subfamily F protein 3